MFDLADSVRLVPVYFSADGFAMTQADIGKPFLFLPVAFSVNLFKPGSFPNTRTLAMVSTAVIEPTISNMAGKPYAVPPTVSPSIRNVG